MSHGACSPHLPRQSRLYLIKGLNPALLVECEHRHSLGRLEIATDDFSERGDELGYLETLKQLMRRGLNSRALQTRAIVA